MIRHRYPPASLLADYGRAGVGFAATSLPMLFLPADAAIVPVLGALALLFAGFAGRTALKQGMAIEMTQEGIAATGAWPADIRWSALDRLNLAYYSTRRDRRNGWMQLTLGAEDRKLRVDSTLAGFQEVVRRSADAARINGLTLDPATLDNLGHIGIGAETGVSGAATGEAVLR